MKSKLLSGMVLFMVSAAVMAQQSFSSPDRATRALAIAISEHNESALSALLGEKWRDVLPPEGVDPDAVDRFLLFPAVVSFFVVLPLGLPGLPVLPCCFFTESATNHSLPFL